MDGKARSPAGWIVAVIVVLAVFGVGFFLWRAMEEQATPPPEFPGLAEDPDPALHGTVAWVDVSDGCVKMIAASGAAQRTLACIEEEVTGGVALEWLDDGRLQMTKYDWPMPDPMVVAWRRIVDPATLEVEDVPAAGAPRTPPLLREPGPAPDGSRVVTEVEGGRMTITLEGAGGDRMLFDGRGAPDYGTSGFPPMWSADQQWLLVNDGRLLVVTIAEPAVTRILVEDTSSWTSAGIPGVALTGEDLLAP